MYGNFECILRPTSSKGVKSSDKNKVSYTEKYQDHIPCSFAYKFSKDVVLYRGKNAVYKFIGAIHEEYDYCKKSDKKHF